MGILLVEDDKPAIMAIINMCAPMGWQYERVDSYRGALDVLTDERKVVSPVIIDVILPWGEGAPVAISKQYSNQKAGLYLLEAMRDTDLGRTIVEAFGYPELGDRHVKTPVIILSRVGNVKSRCEELGIEMYINKMTADFRTLIDVIDPHYQK